MREHQPCEAPTPAPLEAEARRAFFSALERTRASTDQVVPKALNPIQRVSAVFAGVRVAHFVGVRGPIGRIWRGVCAYRRSLRGVVRQATRAHGAGRRAPRGSPACSLPIGRCGGLSGASGGAFVLTGDPCEEW